MAFPWRYHQRIWTAATATETVTLNADVATVPSIILSMELTGFSGTFDIQGRQSADHTYRNVRYAELTGDGALTVVNDQISHTTITATHHYQTVEYWPQVRIVMTASAGTITAADVWGHEGMPIPGNQVAVSSFPDNEPFNVAQWGGTAVPGGSGTVTAGSPRVVLATDVALPAGTNNIGDVDVLSTTYPAPSSSTTTAPTVYNYIAAAVTKATIKASAGNVYSIRVVNRNGSARWFQLHNKATDPAAAEAPQSSFYVPGNSVMELTTSFFAPSERFSTGIGWAWSTVAGTFTDSATASEHDVLARYV